MCAHTWQSLSEVGDLSEPGPRTQLDLCRREQTRQNRSPTPAQGTRTPAVYREREPLQTLQEQYRGAAEQQRAHRRERPSQTRGGINGGARCEFSAATHPLPDFNLSGERLLWGSVATHMAGKARLDLNLW